MSEELQIIPDRSVQLGALRADSPTNVVDVATLVANKLNHVVESKKLYANVQGKKFPTCEAWTTCAAMLGISAKEKSVSLTEDGDYEAEVELIDGNGLVVGGASAICGSDEATWKSRPRYARRSMAVTRATSKACRLKLSWIMTLAGYQPCPAEEVSEEGFGHAIEKRQEQREQVANGNGHKTASEWTGAREAKSSFSNLKRVMHEPTPSAAIEAGDWRNVQIHFGKNKGTPLGELSSRQLDWYAKDWVQKKQEDTREPSEQDHELVAALLAYTREMSGNAKKMTAAVAADDDDEIPGIAHPVREEDEAPLPF